MPFDCPHDFIDPSLGRKGREERKKGGVEGGGNNWENEWILFISEK